MRWRWSVRAWTRGGGAPPSLGMPPPPEVLLPRLACRGWSARSWWMRRRASAAVVWSVVPRRLWLRGTPRLHRFACVSFCHSFRVRMFLAYVAQLFHPTAPSLSSFPLPPLPPCGTVSLAPVLPGSRPFSRQYPSKPWLQTVVLQTPMHSQSQATLLNAPRHLPPRSCRGASSCFILSRPGRVGNKPLNAQTR